MQNPILPALPGSYRAKDTAAGLAVLDASSWGQKYSAWWRKVVEGVPFFEFPESLRMTSTSVISAFSTPVAFLCSASGELFLRPGLQDFQCERVETQSRLAGAMAPRPAARFPGHALTASSTVPVWSGPRRRSCRQIRCAIFVRHGRPRGKE